VGRVGLDRDAVVRAALEIADADGFDRVSMRRVSQALGVTPMAIYHYLPGKDALVDLVIDESLRVVLPVDPTGDVLSEFRRCLGGLYDLLVNHPSLARVVGEHPLEGPVAARLGDKVLELLQQHNLRERDAANLLVSAFGLALGCAVYRTSRRGETGRLAEVGDEAPAVQRLRVQIAAARADDSPFYDALDRLVIGYLQLADRQIQ
jgi:AcrR family transcriptional regulator